MEGIHAAVHFFNFIFSALPIPKSLGFFGLMVLIYVKTSKLISIWVKSKIQNPKCPLFIIVLFSVAPLGPIWPVFVELMFSSNDTTQLNRR